MWGEIEAPVKAQPTVSEKEDEGKLESPEDDIVTLSLRYGIKEPAEPQQARLDTQVSSAVKSSEKIRYTKSTRFAYIHYVSADYHAGAEPGRVHLCE